MNVPFTITLVLEGGPATLTLLPWDVLFRCSFRFDLVEHRR
jgi:hypothetical protein